MADPVRSEDIEALVAQFEASHCTELHIRCDGFELHLSDDAAADPIVRRTAPPASAARSAAPADPAPAAPSVATGADDLDGLEIVRAPYLGTFYRAPKPGEPAYVEIDAKVGPETEICLVEVMKLFTAVRAGVTGRIARILAVDGAMVEGGQPLFAIDPKG